MFDRMPDYRPTFYNKDDSKIVLKIWAGYFDEIMNKIKPESTGWTGLAYYYHLHLGWYEQSPWKIIDLNYVIQQLQELDVKNLDVKTYEVYKEILGLMLNANKINKDVCIEYD